MSNLKGMSQKPGLPVQFCDVTCHTCAGLASERCSPLRNGLRQSCPESTAPPTRQQLREADPVCQDSPSYPQPKLLLAKCLITLPS